MSSPFEDLSPSVKLGSAAIVMGGLGLTAYAVVNHLVSNTVATVGGVGLAGVGALLMTYFLVRRYEEWLKSQDLSRRLMHGPSSGLSAEQMADLPAMRRAFEGGVEKFRAAGRNLYKTPWYVVVGEAGSGKTEAIRRSAVPMIPGLQDKLQGTGGTINMHWWFTREAVILDTAGRVLFEQNVPGMASEFNEFLRLLKRYRPHCPINGMLLMISAETLLKESTEKIDADASRIAEQFDYVQRTLGIRFPVFAVITKCDYIEGFREFFESLNDGRELNQILGWSNPDSLDAPFDPEKLEEHLELVRKRLLRRRQRILEDPVNEDDPFGSRLDRVDALYGLPNNLTWIGPRLGQYLDNIFAGGSWSEKPLFLRGIYFTSSIQHGAPLDVDLAQALGVPVESLPTGNVKERERTYFLKDLFMEKVFQESGLVTRKVKVGRLQHSRRLTVLSTLIVGVLLLIALTLFFHRQLDERVKDRAMFWKSVLEMYDKGPKSPVAFVPGDKPDYWATYNSPKIKGGSPNDALPAALEQCKIYAETPVTKDVPAIFKLNEIGSSLPAAQKEAAGRLVRNTAAEPLLEAVTTKMANEHGDKWDQQDPGHSDAVVAALIELGQLEARSQDPKKGRLPDLGPLCQYVLRTPPPQDDLNKLKDVFEWAYSRDDETGRLSALAASANPKVPDAIEGGVNAYVAYSRKQDASIEFLRARFAEYAKLLEAFSQADKEHDDPGLSAAEREEKYEALQLAKRNALKSRNDLLAAKVPLGGGKALADVFSSNVNDALTKRAGNLNELLKQIPDLSDLAGARSKLQGEIDRLKTGMTGQNDKDLLDRLRKVSWVEDRLQHM